MRIGIPGEIGESERRVALLPQQVEKLTGMGASVAVQQGLGRDRVAAASQPAVAHGH